MSNKFLDTLFLYEVVYQEGFLGQRSAKKRSLLSVNEHFKYEYNAEITLFDSFIICTRKNLYYLCSVIQK